MIVSSGSLHRPSSAVEVAHGVGVNPARVAHIVRHNLRSLSLSPPVGDELQGLIEDTDAHLREEHVIADVGAQRVRRSLDVARRRE